MTKIPIWRWGRWYLLGFLALRLLFWGVTFPNPDEAYYWLWGQHPGLSYYDHPPFHSWVQGLFAAGLGRSTLVLRLPNLLSTALLGWAYWQICRYLYPGEGADRLGLVVLLGLSSPLFFLFLALAWHDHWLITFAVLSSLCFVQFADAYRATGAGDRRWLLGAALCLGLAGLCKYNAVFVGLGFLAVILSDRQLRPLLRDRQLYLALALLLLVLSPILGWNLQHDFFSFRFYRDRTAGADQFTLNWLQPLGFLALCGLILGPIQTWAIGKRAWQGQRPGQSTAPTSCYSALAWWMFGLSTAAFTALSLVSVAVYYWNILAYPLLFPLLSQVFYRADGGLTRRRHLAIAQGLGLFVAAALVFHYTVIPFTALGGEADPDSAALYGWDSIAAAVTTQAAGLDQPLLLTTDYRSASALAYVLDDPQVLAISGRIDQFDFWYDSAALEGRDAVLLGESWHPICPAHLAMFERADPPQTLEIRRWGRVLQTYELVTGYGFKAGPPGYPLRPDYPLAFTSDGEQCAP
ncbi:glycosyltransferase family 39 protein [Nodosilinea sp. P-1105]|uniref:ArnT family glycosyltransferase n=1 Tax=Nodosilinea sp. P-1105 TaxID=2546229 RepID=UPI00146E64AB|nr:glycosyltransferase family 39 protein [Nodosilinea sp. P-1105]NMF85722.1 phospholipid carrier-dependent glycosyltransferase [Nodosilinea sp. P-1105]